MRDASTRESNDRGPNRHGPKNPCQWDPKSPWHDKRTRLAANYAIDRQAINQAETLGFSRLTYSFIPSNFEFFWSPPVSPYDPARARQLLAEAGYPNGLDAGGSRTSS